MIWFYGTRNYGTVCEVPGLFYVVTRFAYLQFFPLFPTGSFLVFVGSEQDDGSFHGVKIGVHLRSVLAGYVRAWGGVAAMVLGGFAAAVVGERLTLCLPGNPIGSLAGLALGVILVLAAVLAVFVRRPLGLVALLGYFFASAVALAAVLAVKSPARRGASPQLAEVLTILAFANAAMLAVGLVRYWNHASRETALALADRAGLDPRVIEEHFDQQQGAAVALGDDEE